MAISNRSRLRLLGGGALGALLTATAAHAQPVGNFLADRYFAEGVPGYGPEPGVTVLSRSRPDYDAQGIREGSFIVRPEVDESLGYNDNLLGVKNGPGSFVADSQAQIAVNSDWGRNSLGGLVSVDNRQTPAVASQDRTDYGITLGGTYEFGRDVLSLGGTHLQLHQDPTTIDALTPTGVNGAQYSTYPVAYTLDDVRATYTTSFGRISLIPDIDYARLQFSKLNLIPLNGAPQPSIVNGVYVLPGNNTVPVSQNYRNRDIVTGGTQVRYEFSPQRNAVLDIQDVNTNYVSNTAGSYGPSRSSNAVVGMAGLDYVASAVWRYRVLFGIEYRDFNSAQYKSHTAPVGEADVIWSPSGLTTVTAKAAHTIEDAADESTSGYEYTSAVLRVDHEYLRNVLLSAYAGIEYASYLQSSNSETVYGGGVGATYLVNRNVRLSLTYDVSDRTGSQGSSGQGTQSFGQNFVQNIYMLQIRLAL